MLTARMSTPIGEINLGTSDHGLRLLQFPRRTERDMPFAESDEGVDRIAEAWMDEARKQLGEYFDGTRTEFDLALDWYGVNGLRREVLERLAKVPFGSTVTYGDLARGVGQPGAAQAVGGIMGSNPLPIVVPCHRVLAADGLGGFGGGVRTKEWLLAWEGVLPPALDWEF